MLVCHFSYSHPSYLLILLIMTYIPITHYSSNAICVWYSSILYKLILWSSYLSLFSSKHMHIVLILNNYPILINLFLYVHAKIIFLHVHAKIFLYVYAKKIFLYVHAKIIFLYVHVKIFLYVHVKIFLYVHVKIFLYVHAKIKSQLLLQH